MNHGTLQAKRRSLVFSLSKTDAIMKGAWLIAGKKMSETSLERLVRANSELPRTCQA